jgi:hypothetical protein
LGEVGYSLYASRGYLARCGTPKRGAGLAGYDLIAFTGAPAVASPFFMGEGLDDARMAVRCDNPLIQLQAARIRVVTSAIVEAFRQHGGILRRGVTGLKSHKQRAASMR